MHIGAIAYKKFNLNGRSSDRLMVLLERLGNLTEATDFRSLLIEILETSRQVMGAEASSLMLLDREKDELVIKLPSEKGDEVVEDKRIPKYEGYCGWVVEHQIPLIVNDVDPENELYQKELYENYNIQNLICSPLFDEQHKVIGILQVANRSGEQLFEKQDLPIFEMLAKHVSRSIQKVISEVGPEKQLEEKDLMITELHHRMKNNLDLISGMLEMEESKLRDSAGKEVLKKIQSRVKSVNIVYDLLSAKKQYSEVELSPYIKELVEGISKALATPVRDIKIEVNIDEISLHPDRALLFGLILNELLVNSYKHAFKYKSEGTITVDIARKDGTVRLLYKDNGIGMPVDFDEEEYGAHGFKLIRSLTDKLYGDFSFNKKTGYKGIECSLEFPDFRYIQKS
jgi:two-component sensor histidine kinase